MPKYQVFQPIEKNSVMYVRQGRGRGEVVAQRLSREVDPGGCLGRNRTDAKRKPAF